MTGTTDMRELTRLLLIQQGMDPAKHLSNVHEETPAGRERATLNLQSTLIHLEWPEKPRLNKDCKVCGHRFVTDYKFVAYCGPICAADALAHYGIDWSDKPLREHFSNMLPPRIIPPDALAAMANCLQQAGYTVLHPRDASSSVPEPVVHSLPKKPEQIQTKNETPKKLETEPAEEDFFLDLLFDS